MGTTLIGSMALFLLSLSTTVQPADPSLLAVPEVQAPLMKNALQPVESRTSNHFYKPYSLFGEQLSHISEEDASMLQRMSSQQRPTSLASRLSYGSRTTTAGFAYYIDYPWIAASRTPITRTSTTPNNGPECQPIVLPSLELALLPLSSCEAPMAVLMTLWPPLRFPPDEEELIYSYPIAVSAATQYSLILSMALLGMAWAMMNSFLFLYLYDSLHLPMYTVGIIGAVTAVTDTLAKASSMRLTRRFNVNLMIGLLHLDIILCAFIYTWLQPDHMATQIAALVLQIVQTLAFHLIWLIAYQQVDDILFVNEQRMFLRGVMSALYASLGPAMGVLVVGLLVNEDVKADMALQGFQSVYQSVVGLVAFSSVVSWGWTSSLSV
ncbi:uncharacterized protein BYT42DRAFT_501827 [Radiomyces spectabilis]|uniref:uncharacterized protein n=1 Tax=Radiomyces spectabilis TaxID=64574 RepID=UPI00221F144B|nr:uncharacterized protein BYT42DRAFT_501827 [Radiomyces spectabilis]KAI8371637.1 hypothetical protein BYT42DRAFT_501827 [Radiomyces spectabilis]